MIVVDNIDCKINAAVIYERSRFAMHHFGLPFSQKKGFVFNAVSSIFSSNYISPHFYLSPTRRNCGTGLTDQDGQSKLH